MLTIGLEHFSLFVKRTAVVMAHMAPQQGMNWRDYMGSIICLIGYKVRSINILDNHAKCYEKPILSLIGCKGRSEELINQRTTVIDQWQKYMGAKFTFPG